VLKRLNVKPVSVSAVFGVMEFAVFVADPVVVALIE
jgi:hypothetical protein